MKTLEKELFTINCTGDVCTGDTILFERAVFVGRYPKVKFSHTETVVAEVIKDSYGKMKQQHTFTLYDIEEDITFTIKGRNLYRNGVKRIKWEDETKRVEVLEDKHNRGNKARAARDERKSRIDNTYFY